MAGQRVGRWLVVSREPSSKGGLAMWLCRCDCGTERVMKGTHLRQRKSRSCGCVSYQSKNPKISKHLVGKRFNRLRVLSRVQHVDIKKISDNPFDAQKGDLYFFGDDKINVDHVGIALGNGKIIHSRGMVRINSFDNKHPDFSQQLKDTLMAVSSVF